MLAEGRLVVRLAVGIVFLLSAAAKLRDPRAFARGIREFKILPKSLSGQASFVVILLESWLAFAHLGARQLVMAVPVGITLLLSFGLAVFVNLRRGRKIPCHCFGRRSEVISVRTVARILMVMLCEIYLLATKQLLHPWAGSSSTSLGLPLFWAIFLLVLGSWLLSAPDIAVLIRPTVRARSRSDNIDILSATSDH